MKTKRKCYSRNIGFVLLVLCCWVPVVFAKSPERKPTAQPVNSQEEKADISQIVKTTQQSVVDIQTTGHFKLRYRTPLFLEVFFSEFFGRPLSQETKTEYKSAGTGIVIESNGLILTNAHVVSLFDEIQVRTYDNKWLKAELISKDFEHDLALLEIKEPYKFKSIEMADPSQIKVAEPVFAIGNPYSYSQTVTQGIVSAINRLVDIDPKHPLENMIQTTADVNPGNSGGPLINQSGQMIGVMTIRDPRARGINFAISVETVREFLPKLKIPPVQSEDFKTFAQKFGFSVQERKDESGGSYLIISDIVSTSPAFQSGLRADDILYHFQNKDLRNLNDLFKASNSIKPKETVYVQIKRNQQIFFTYIGAK